MFEQSSWWITDGQDVIGLAYVSEQSMRKQWQVGR